MSKSDIEIAQEAQMQPISEIAEKIGIPDRYVENYGKYKAKIDYRYYNEELKKPSGRKADPCDSDQPDACGRGKDDDHDRRGGTR
jgi:formate--tetrahydrofolate ligase